MRVVEIARQPFRQPVIAPRLPALAVHALLHDDPPSVVGDDETVQIEVEAVLHRGVVNFCDQTARPRERPAIEADTVADRQKLVRRLAGMRASAAADMEAELGGQRLKTALQGADDRCRDARRMPVHAHDGAEGLEPEGVCEPAQEFVAAIFDHDGFGDHRAELGHALAEPARHAAIVERQVRAASAARHQPRILTVRSCLRAPAAPDRGARDRRPARRAGGR